METNPGGYLISSDEWWEDMMFGAFCALLALLFLLVLGFVVLGAFHGFIIGIGAWIVFVSFAFRWFSVSVPEVSGLMVQNYFAQPTEEDAFANMRVYPTGLHPRKFWKKIVSYIDLRQGEIPFNEDFPAKNGVPVRFTGIATYLPQARWIPVYIAVSAATIRSVIMQTITGWLSVQVSKKSAPEEAREALQEFQEGLMKHVEESKEQLAAEERQTGRGVTFERRLGVDVTRVTIGDVGYNDAYQMALNQRAESGILQGVAEKWRIDQKLLPRDAADMALLVSKKAEKKIIAFEGAREIARTVTNGIVHAIKK